MSLFKYFGQAANDSGDSLSWSQHLDAPFRGVPPLLRGAEFDDQLATVNDFRFKEFDLHDPSQTAAYREVMDRIVNGWYVLITCERAKDETGRIRYVYLEWTERYTVQKPPTVFDKGPPHASSPF